MVWIARSQDPEMQWRSSIVIRRVLPCFCNLTKREGDRPFIPLF